MHKLSILLCGQVRSLELMTPAIEAFARMKAAGIVRHIVYSTWHGEIDGYPGLRDMLSRYGVETVEAAPPQAFMESRGNYYFQAVQLKNGLERIDPADIVFKTRPDIRINAALDLVRFADFANRELAAAPASPILLNRPIGIALSNTVIPFWIEDRYFWGLGADLRMLTTMSRVGDIFGHPHTFIAEARWFASLFAEFLPVMRHVMRIDWMLRAHRENSELSALFFETDIIYRCLAAYHYVIETHFVVGFESEALDLSHYDATPEPAPTIFGRRRGDEALDLLEKPAYRDTLATLRDGGTALLTSPAWTDRFRTGISALAQRPEFAHLVRDAY